MSSSTPEILDLRDTPCPGPSGGPSCAVGQSQSTAATEAEITFSDISAFLNSFCPFRLAGRQSADVRGAFYARGGRRIPATAGQLVGQLRW